jgi:hypothetical protein
MYGGRFVNEEDVVVVSFKCVNFHRPTLLLNYH